MTHLYDTRGSFYPLTPKARSNCQHKVHPARFGREMGCIKLGELFSPRCRGLFCTGVFFKADGSVVLGKLTLVHTGRGGGGKNKWKLGSRGQFFAIFWPIFVFWALLLKVQTTITSSIIGVSSSSLDSRQLSAIPFNNTPVSGLRHKHENKNN